MPRSSNSLLVLERLRARKTPDELLKLRLATDLVVDSMLAVIDGHGPGVTKQEIVDALRREETNRGLVFEYCLITAGQSSQSGALTSEVAERGDHVDQFWRELSRLHR